MGPSSSQRVALVGCAQEKLPSPALARDLYTSALFRAARRYAEETCDEWHVLSAAHGLVHPTRELAPYDVSLVTMPREERETWAARTAAELVQAFRGRPVRLVVLAGAEYARAVELSGLPYDTPLAGLQVGERRAWFKRATAAAVGWRFIREAAADGGAVELDAETCRALLAERKAA
jgi:hypothetical protein